MFFLKKKKKNKKTDLFLLISEISVLSKHKSSFEWFGMIFAAC